MNWIRDTTLDLDIKINEYHDSVDSIIQLKSKTFNNLN